MQDVQHTISTRNQRTSYLISFLLHLLLLLIFFIPWLNRPPAPKEIAGILVSFGEIDGGLNDELSEQSDILTDEAAEAAAESEAPAEEASEDEAETPPVAEADPAPESTPSEPERLSSPVSDAPPVAEEPSKNDLEKEAQQKAEQAAREKAAAEAAAKARAEAEAAKKKKEFEDKKNRFGNLLGQGRGNGGQAGNEGNPEGDPDGAALDALSAGSGNIGGGLTNRGVVYEPQIKDYSQSTGTVVLDICVDQTGKVTEARWTQKGSTTTDQTLVKIATDAAYKYRFTAAEVDRQCGSITIKFELK